MDIFETERLMIRRFEPDDWKDLYAYLSDESVVRFEPYAVFSETECKIEAQKRAINPAFWAVCLRESSKLIGNVYLNQTEPSDFLTWELGYVFNARYQGKGYAFESCRALIGHVFDALNAHRVIATCNPDNVSSWRLLERLKFRREGHFLQNVCFHCDAQGWPVWQDTYEYAMLAGEWNELTQGNRDYCTN